jgi:hypothetical protein
MSGKNSGKLPDPIQQLKDDIGLDQLEMDGGIANDKMESLANLYKMMSAEELRALVGFRKGHDHRVFH